jgi:hypothetical protein
MSRPRKDQTYSKRTISLSPEAESIIQQGGYQTNLSAFIDGLIRSTSADSAPILAVKIKAQEAKVATIEEELRKETLTLRQYQVQLNLVSTNAKAVDSAREQLLRRWRELSRTAGRDRTLIGWLTGPANIHLIKDAGFDSPETVLNWLREQPAKP